LKKWTVELERTYINENVIVEADYMEIGNTLVFKNRNENTVVAAFQNWLSVKEDDGADS
jgi:hypothetical protein